MPSSLTPEERRRYSRHLVLEGFGVEQQLALKNARVIVVGAGGLGCPVLLYLAAAGVGTIGIVDSDTVEVSNLQRQVLFTDKDIGYSKASCAAKHLSERNPHLTIREHALRLDSSNALQVLQDYDLVIDGSDNFPTRYLVNDASVLLDKPLVYGSILQYEGQVSVLNMKENGGARTTNYRDLFPEPPKPGTVQNCAEAGVLGVMAGLLGTLMANEALKIITGTGTILTNRLLLVDSQTLDFNTIRFRERGTRSTIKKLIDYDDFCGLTDSKTKTTGMKEVDVYELKELKDSGADFQLIDVREPHERDICEIGGDLIPMVQVPHSVEKIARNKQVVIYCRSGNRSGKIIAWLEQNHDFDNLYNLKGGILDWAREIDPEMEQY